MEFLDKTIGIVSSTWLKEDTSMTLWPPNIDPSKHRRALVMHEDPGETWTTYEITSLGTAGRFVFSLNCKSFILSIACKVTRTNDN